MIHFNTLCGQNTHYYTIITIGDIKMTVSKDNKRIQVTIPKKIFNQLKFDAEYEGRSISNLVAKIIKDYYKECEES